MYDPVEDALDWGRTINRVISELEAHGELPPNAIRQDRPPKPDPEHPGEALLEYHPPLRETAKGGILYGEWDCGKCGQPFFMEIALNEKKQPIASLGGVVFREGVALCDDCSPI